MCEEASAFLPFFLLFVLGNFDVHGAGTSRLVFLQTVPVSGLDISFFSYETCMISGGMRVAASVAELFHLQKASQIYGVKTASRVYGKKQ
jgi:hypothetical protein